VRGNRHRRNRRVASLRARDRVKTLDAISFSSAVLNRADCFITDDEGFRIPGVRIGIVADSLAQVGGPLQPGQTQSRAA
jgi:hypothetical protein